MKSSIGIFLIVLFFSQKICFAGGAMLRRKQQLEQRKQQIEQQLIQQKKEEYRQKALRKQQAYRQQALQQQKAAYRQRALQQQQHAVQQKATQQRQQQIARQRAVRQQQVVAQQRAVAQQKAIQQRQAIQLEGTQRVARQNISISKQREDAEVKDIVTIAQIWESMETTSEVWALMLDVNPKVATVDRYIEWYKQRGIVIQNPPIYYVQMIDAMSKNSSAMLKSPFEEVLKKVAIIEYDFDNGRDKDLMAREILGEEAFQKNKARLGR